MPKSLQQSLKQVVNPENKIELKQRILKAYESGKLSEQDAEFLIRAFDLQSA